MPSDKTKRAVYSAIAFGSAMFLSVLLFEARAGFRSLADSGSFSLVILPYSLVVLFAVLLGAYLSRWYYESRGLFEVVAAPFVVGVVSVFLSGQALALASLLSGGAPGVGAAEVVAAGLYSSLIFVLGAWPAMLVALPVASFAVSRHTDNTGSVNAA